jgi:sulfopyruvate decarboxylase alpha subunit
MRPDVTRRQEASGSFALGPGDSGWERWQTPAMEPAVGANWSHEVFRLLRAADVRHMSYVPDAGHSTLIDLFGADEDVTCNVLTTEEEGIAISVGAWLGGERSIVLMQSSGVGNCINMLSLPVLTRSPLLMLVTMRGEWAEFNPWQIPMSQATQTSLEAIGVTVHRADNETDLIEVVEQAANTVYDSDRQVAVLIGQRLLGEKVW